MSKQVSKNIPGDLNTAGAGGWLVVRNSVEQVGIMGLRTCQSWEPALGLP